MVQETNGEQITIMKAFLECLERGEVIPNDEIFCKGRKRLGCSNGALVLFPGGLCLGFLRLEEGFV